MPNTSEEDRLKTVKAPWDDLRFPANRLSNVPGQANPALDAATPGLLFRHTATDVVVAILQLPHEWYEGTPLKPHVHWTKTTSAGGEVYWQFEYRWASIRDVIDPEWTVLGTTFNPVPHADTADMHAITPFGEIHTYGRKVSDMLLMRLSRVHNNAADTYGASARLLELDLHIQVNGADGTLQEFPGA